MWTSQEIVAWFTVVRWCGLSPCLSMFLPSTFDARWLTQPDLKEMEQYQIHVFQKVLWILVVMFCTWAKLGRLQPYAAFLAASGQPVAVLFPSSHGTCWVLLLGTPFKNGDKGAWITGLGAVFKQNKKWILKKKVSCSVSKEPNYIAVYMLTTRCWI